VVGFVVGNLRPILTNWALAAGRQTACLSRNGAIWYLRARLDKLVVSDSPHASRQDSNLQPPVLEGGGTFIGRSSREAWPENG
jgi:hypothetical protein